MKVSFSSLFYLKSKDFNAYKLEKIFMVELAQMFNTPSIELPMALILQKSRNKQHYKF